MPRRHPLSAYLEGFTQADSGFFLGHAVSWLKTTSLAVLADQTVAHLEPETWDRNFNFREG
jgi:hypothetical protein